MSAIFCLPDGVLKEPSTSFFQHYSLHCLSSFAWPEVCQLAPWIRPSVQMERMSSEPAFFWLDSQGCSSTWWCYQSLESHIHQGSQGVSLVWGAHQNLLSSWGLQYLIGTSNLGLESLIIQPSLLADLVNCHEPGKKIGVVWSFSL